MQERITVLGKKFVSCICALIMCIAFIPAASLSAFAVTTSAGGGVTEGQTITVAVPFEPTDATSSETSINIKFKVLEYDEDSNTGKVQVGTGSVSCSTSAAGKITLPQTIEYEGATLTVSAIGSYAFSGCKSITHITLPETIETFNTCAFQQCIFDKLVIPASMKTWSGRYMQGGQGNVKGTTPYFEWKGNCSEITTDNAYNALVNQCGGQNINHIFWGDAGGNSTSIANMYYGPVLKSNTSQSLIHAGLNVLQGNGANYLWFPITYYPSQADAEAGTNSLGTIYVSFNKGQTNSSTMYASDLMKQSNITYADVANKKLEAKYFLNYDDGTHKTLTDYPAYPEGTDKWVFVGNPNTSDALSGGASCYPVKADETNIGQGSISGIESSYVITGEDIEPSFTLCDVNGNVISSDNYAVTYQRKDGNNWVDASAKGQHGSFGETYRMVITAKGSYTGTLTTKSYSVRAYSEGDILTSKINHTATDGTKDTIDCRFKVISAPKVGSDGKTTAGTVMVGTEPDSISASNYTTDLAINPSTTGSIEIPESVSLFGLQYNVVKVGKFAFGSNSDSYACKISYCDLPNSIISIDKNAFCRCQNLKQACIPASVTTVENSAFFMGSYNTQPENNLKSYLFKGGASKFTSNKVLAPSTYQDTNFLFMADSDFPNEYFTKTFEASIINWYKVDFYASESDASADTNATSIYVKEGTNATDILSGTYEALAQDGTQAKTPSLPSGKTAWAVSSASDYGSDAEVTCGSKLKFYASDAAKTDLSTARVKNLEGKVWYTASAYTPSFTLESADGAVIDSSKYSISYQLKQDDDSWETVSTCKDAGSYRIVIKANLGSGYTGEFVASFKIVRPSVGQKVTYPVENVLPSGAKQNIDMTFEITKAGEGNDHGTVAVANSKSATSSYTTNYRAVSYDTKGSIVIPQTIKLGEATFDVTKIGPSAFQNITGITGVTIPEGIESIGYYAFDTTSLKQVIIPSTVKEIGGQAFSKSKSTTSTSQDANGTIEEVIFKGTVQVSKTANSSSQVWETSMFKNVSTTKGAFILENETANRTIRFSSNSTLRANVYLKANFYNNANDATIEENSIGYVYIKKGSTPSTAASNLYSGAYCKNTIPSIPSTAPEGSGWTYKGFDGSAIADSGQINVCTSVYTSASLDSLSNYGFSNSFNGIDYPYTGESITPDYGSVVSADGKTLDSTYYVIRPQKKGADGKWADVQEAVEPGTYRLEAVPAYGSGLVDQLYSKPYTITKVTDPTTTRFNYPLKYVSKADGSTTLVNCTFLVIGDNEVKTSGVTSGTATGSGGVGIPGIAVPSYDGELYLPETVSLNGKSYTLTTLGSYSFNIADSSDVLAGLHIPSTVTTLEKDLYSVNGSNSNWACGFSRIYYEGDCNITSMSTNSSSYSWTKNGTGSEDVNELVFTGKVSDFIKNISDGAKYHFNDTYWAATSPTGKTYDAVRFYASKQAYENGENPIATVGILDGTKMSAVSLSPSSVTVAASMDKIPAFTGENNFWCFADVDSIDEKITDGTLCCYQKVATATDLSTCVVSTDFDDYIATGSPISPKVSVVSVYDNKELSSDVYKISYQRKSGNDWVDTTDITTAGTLRVKITPSDGSTYTNEAYSAAFTIHTVQNEQGEKFKAETNYLEKGTAWSKGMDIDKKVTCFYQILKPASDTEEGFIMVSRGTTRLSSYYEPCVSDDLDGTLVLPEKIKTDKGTFKLAAVANMTFQNWGNNLDWAAFGGTALTGLVIPDSLDYKAAAEATKSWATPTKNEFDFTGASKLESVYFDGDFADYVFTGASDTWRVTGGRPQKACYIFTGEHASVSSNVAQYGTFLGLYYNVTFYSNKADADAKTNALGSARVISEAKLSAMSSTMNTETEQVYAGGSKVNRYKVWQDGGAIPEFPEGTDRWVVSDNVEADATLNDTDLSVYPIATDATNLSQAVVYNPGVPENPQETDSPLVYTLFTSSKVYDGEALGSDFVLKDKEGNIIPSDAYTTTYERLTNDGKWETTKDFSSMGKFRITVKAIDGKGYTGEKSITCTISVPDNFNIPMTYTTASGEQNVNVNVVVNSIDEATNTINASIAPTESGKAVTISSDYAGGTLKLVDSVENGMYKVKISSIKAGAFGDSEQDKAVEALGGVIIPAGIETIEAGAFEKAPCDVTFAQGAKTNVEANAFKQAGTQAITFDGNAADVNIDKDAFYRALGDENSEISILFNAEQDKSKSYGYATAIYPRETAVEDLDEAYVAAQKEINALSDLSTDELKASLESLMQANAASAAAIEEAATIADLNTAVEGISGGFGAVVKNATEVSNANAAEKAAKKAAEEEKAKELARISAEGYSELVGTGAAAATYKITSSDDLTVQYVKAGEQAYTAKAITIPATVKLSNGKTYKVTSIAAKAVSGKAAATKIVIGDNVKTVGAQAFSGCFKVKTLVLGKAAKTIKAKAFKACKKLKTVTVNSKSLTKSSFKNLLKSSKIKTVKCKVLAKKASVKAKYKKYAAKYKKSTKVK